MTGLNTLAYFSIGDEEKTFYDIDSSLALTPSTPSSQPTLPASQLPRPLPDPSLPRSDQPPLPLSPLPHPTADFSSATSPSMTATTASRPASKSLAAENPTVEVSRLFEADSGSPLRLSVRRPWVLPPATADTPTPFRPTPWSCPPDGPESQSPILAKLVSFLREGSLPPTLLLPLLQAPTLLPPLLLPPTPRLLLLPPQPTLLPALLVMTTLFRPTPSSTQLK
jgi:hypothetical protein